MKISKILLLIVALASGAIAIPFAFPIQSNMQNISQYASTMATIVLFICCFMFMVCIGWVKRADK